MIRLGIVAVVAHVSWSTGQIAAAQIPVGITIEKGEVLRVDLGNGDSTVVADLGDPSLTLYSLTADGLGGWYGLAYEDGELAFYRVAGGVATRLGGLGDASGGGALELGPDGLLYFASAGMLHRLDPASMETTPLFPIPGQLTALATVESALYGLRRDPGHGCSLERINLASGSVTTVDPVVSCGHDLAPFDPDLLIVASWTPIMGVYVTGVERFDLATGETEWIGTWGNDVGDPVWKTLLPSLTDVTIQGGVDAVEIPTLSAASLAALALVLVGVAVRSLAAQRHAKR